jgi:hypothetical protein
MTIPRGKANILDFEMVPGRPLFRSWLLLFDVLPIDRSDITLLEVEQGRRFLEQSPMLIMKLWRHERVITPTADGTLVTDNLEFSPRFAVSIVRGSVKFFFQHRHLVLRRMFNNDGGRSSQCITYHSALTRKRAGQFGVKRPPPRAATVRFEPGPSLGAGAGWP